MKLKGSWFRILGLLLVLSFVTACGAAGTTTDNTAGSPAASAASSTAAASAASSTAGGAGATIKIGSKNFTEQFILGEMYAQLLEANGFMVERDFGLASEAVAHQALTTGEIDLYPEYTSTALLTILKLPQQTDRQAIYNTVKDAYNKQFQLTWLEAAPFENNQALAMTRAKAQELGIKTYSDLAAKADQLVLGGPAEFFEREDGVKGLQSAYGGFQFKDNKQLDPALRYGALQDGQIDVVVAFGTDGQIGGFDLQLLEDDKKYYPPYQVAPVIRNQTLQANPRIAEILNPLAAKLDNATMSNLNWAVDQPDSNEEPEGVARTFLQDQGLLPK